MFTKGFLLLFYIGSFAPTFSVSVCKTFFFFFADPKKLGLVSHSQTLYQLLCREKVWSTDIGQVVQLPPDWAGWNNREDNREAVMSGCI